MTTPQRPKMAIFHHTLPNGDILRLVRADEYAKLETERDQLQAQIKKDSEAPVEAGKVCGECGGSGEVPENEGMGGLSEAIIDGGNPPLKTCLTCHGRGERGGK